MKKVLLGIICVALWAIVLESSCTQNSKKADFEAEARAKVEALRDSITESVLPIKSWEIINEIDEMTDAKIYGARLVSNNKMMQDFPYGETRAIICIRNTKKHGNDVILNVTSGQIFGNEYDDTNYVEVRFDNKLAKKYFYWEEASGSSDVIFIKKAKDFIENCKKANNIKIRIPMFQEGWKLFTFHSDELLNWEH